MSPETSIVVTATNVTTSFETVFESSTTSNTIAPSSGFVPIQSGITRQDGIPGKRDEIVARAKKPAAQMVVQDDGTLVVRPRQYPVRVQCLRVLYVTITRFRLVTESASTVSHLRKSISGAGEGLFLESPANSSPARWNCGCMRPRGGGRLATRSPLVYRKWLSLTFGRSRQVLRSPQ